MLLCYNHNHVAVAVGYCLGPVKEKVVGVGKLKLLQQLNIWCYQVKSYQKVDCIFESISGKKKPAKIF